MTFIDQGEDVLNTLAIHEAADFIRRETGKEIVDDAVGVPFRRFRYGTCTGLYRLMPDALEILAVGNEQPSNGCFPRLMKDLGRRAGGKLVRFRQMLNDGLTRHLCERWGFVARGEDCEGRP